MGYGKQAVSEFLDFLQSSAFGTDAKNGDSSENPALARVGQTFQMSLRNDVPPARAPSRPRPAQPQRACPTGLFCNSGFPL